MRQHMELRSLKGLGSYELVAEVAFSSRHPRPKITAPYALSCTLPVMHS